MQIYFVTSNLGKVKEFRQILEPKVTVNHIEMQYPELRSDDPEEIAKMSAMQLADKFKKPIIVEDSGLFIKSLNGFPGTCSSYIHKRIGLKGILRLLKAEKDREAMYMSAVAYCEPQKKPLSFLGTEKGTISTTIRGKNGFGHDPIFIPEGSKKTYGEMEDYAEKKQFRRRAIEKLLKYLG